MSQSTSLTDIPGVVDLVLNDIIEALTNRASMTQPRRDAIAHMVRAMVLGLCPQDVMQLMVAGKAVLFHALTIDAARDVPHDDAGSLKFRAQSAVAALGRTMTRNLEMLTRLQTRAAKEAPAPKPTAATGMAEMLSQLFNRETTFETPDSPVESQLFQDKPAFQKTEPPVTEALVAPLTPLSRKERRWLEREQARLARKMPASQPAMHQSRQ